MSPLEINSLPPPYSPKGISYSKTQWFLLKSVSAAYTFWLLYNLKKHYIGPHEHREPIKTLPNGPWWWDWGEKFGWNEKKNEILPTPTSSPPSGPLNSYSSGLQDKSAISPPLQ